MDNNDERVPIYLNGNTGLERYQYCECSGTPTKAIMLLLRRPLPHNKQNLQLDVEMMRI